ncbi:tRNA (adenosine(37)-N6)-threonylcarbamoyltransferase complex ATPase subunit type 1 TsaE [Merismopedia glauca]|uniref:tRNA threonylcarbamoyladenosine biosynthesis protein TsaE n=1 Tax=Merismopedia glauca CCAP 1448/3 TaxID=1296344 RepID=A0A2T1C1U0_9CYAN|nr:tRNA (adenosine(37)-N6)-threonylcarbamoyltransferase complex ATPase subunit type 1 TsaE [Merismopedia glauca]PSB02239.1 tRNA (adenosine(37)-N6)-threonylcarbamoyltransferase complex ATPase subunit type 1 TsaE [Merismopedia glauca CCAP 1448/3]
MELIQLADSEATHSWGFNLGQSLPAGTTILLEGDLGSGKTSLVQGIAAGLGITEPIASPTFNLINEYHSGRLPLYHLDLYRLESAEVSNLYLENYWDGIEVDLGIVAIEWAERLPYKPAKYLSIQLIYNNQLGRTGKIGYF